MPRSLLIAIVLWLAINAALALTSYHPWAIYDRALSVGSYSPKFQFSRSGEELLCSSYGHTTLRDLETWSVLASLGDANNAVIVHTWHPNEKKLLSHTGRGDLQAWDIQGKSPNWTWPIPPPDELGRMPIVSADGTQLAFVQDGVYLKDCIVRIAPLDPQWDSPPQMDKARIVRPEWGTYSLAFSPSGKELITVARGKLTNWNIDNGKVLASLALPNTGANWSSSIPITYLDANHLLFQNVIVDVDAWKTTGQLLPSSAANTSVTCIAAQGDFVYVGTVSGKMRRVNWKTGVLSRWQSAVVSGEVRRLAVSPDGTMLAAGAENPPKGGGGWDLSGLFTIRAPLDLDKFQLWRLVDHEHE